MLEARKKWDTFADNYTNVLAERWSLPLAHTLVCQLQLDASARSILEVGCGPGNSLSLISNALRAACVAATTATASVAAATNATVTASATRVRYLGTDLSPAMVQKARGQAAAGGGSGCLPQPPLALDVEFRVADACALDAAGVKAGAFDRVLANLCLMLVPDPDLALRQAARALRPGGIAAFSVWGNRSRSHFFELLPRVMKQLGITPPGGGAPAPVRSNYHLVETRDQGKGNGDAGALRGRFERAGFERVVSWHQMAAIPALDGKAFVEQRLAAMPDPGAFAAGLGEEQMAQLKVGLARAADELLANGHPLGLDAVVVIARKKM